MEFHQLVPLSALFCLALLGSHVQASLPAEDYWQTLWPNTPMPKALRDLIQPAASTYQTGYGKVSDPTGGKAIVLNRFFVLEHDLHPGKKLNLGFTKRSDEPATNAKTTQFPSVTYGTAAKVSPIPFMTYGTVAKISPFPFVTYGKVSDLRRSKDKVPNGTFFFEHDLLPGKKLNIEIFTKRLDEFTFLLPDTVAKSIPFSGSRLPEILNRFRLEAKSTDIETVKQTLEACESPAINGEEKYCATSLESLVNFAVSKLGKNTRLLSTEFEKRTQNRQYSVVEGMKKNGDKAVVCHKLDYPYAVFYCHKIDTRYYTVPLVAIGDGTKAKALAVCHTDTTHWHPDHVAFKQLNVKPGTIPICHFLPIDTLLWVPNLW